MPKAGWSGSGLGRWRSPLRALVLVAAMLAGLWGYGVFGHLDGSGLAPPLALRTTAGAAFSFTQLRGRVVLVYFGYLHCPDVCPATLAELRSISRSLGASTSRIAVVFVTLDPARDRPALLRAYLDRFDPHFIGLTGSPEAVARAAQFWRVTFRRAATGNGQYFIDHTTVVALVGPHGRLRARLGPGQLANTMAVAREIRRMLATG